MYETLNALKDHVLTNGKNPRVHPNGFIQLDLDNEAADGWEATKQRGTSGGRVRLHIWNPRGIHLPRQDTVNEIHDHVFEMRSRVVRGSLIQRLYTLYVGDGKEPTHELYRAVYDDKESRLAPTGVKGTRLNHQTFLVSATEAYRQPPFTLHDTFVTPGTLTVTVMEKMEVHDGDASVLCPLDRPPDNSFNRATAAPADELWAAIEASLS